MKIGLFIPCYIDQFYPKVGIATLRLLEKVGCEVVFPPRQTCCGQPMANSGFAHLTAECDANFMEGFKDFDYIIVPSGSCALHLKQHLHSEKNPKLADKVKNSVYELCEFLVDILKIEHLDACFPQKVGLHQSCHGHRGLHLAQMSELVAEPFSKIGQLLSMVKGIELVPLNRVDECCGFGGTFCVTEEAISVKMGKDRVADHSKNGAQVITSADMSCLMHLDGILKRQKSKVQVLHIAEILNSK